MEIIEGKFLVLHFEDREYYFETTPLFEQIFNTVVNQLHDQSY